MKRFTTSWRHADRRSLRRAVAWLLLWSMSWPALVLAAGPAPASPAADWTPAANGQQLLQRSTRLLWSRCVEGMRWSGRDCVGQPLWLDLVEAQALVQRRNAATGQNWRLPYLKELQQLALLSQWQDEATLVPEASQTWIWSGSVPIAMREINPYSYEAVVKGVNAQNVAQMKFLHGWVVNTATGESRDDVLKRTRMQVLMVRRAD